MQGIDFLLIIKLKLRSGNFPYLLLPSCLSKEDGEDRGTNI